MSEITTNNNNNNGNSKYRIEQLEKNQEKISSQLNIIMTNHLPHLEIQMVQLKTRLNTITAINIGALIIALIIQRLWQ